jgi:prepilin peptidase CpaA
MQASFLLVGVLPVLLVAAAIFDLTSYTIPNILPGAMLVLFLIFLLAMALSGHAVSWNEISGHLMAGGLGLIAGMILFALGWIGGGDAKLFAMTCLWLGWDSMLAYAVTASIGGGALTLALLWLRGLVLPVFLQWPWLLRLADPKGAVPYGVALASAALMILPGTEIFHLATAH